MLRTAFIDCSPFVHDLLSLEEWQSVEDLRIHIGDPEPSVLADLLNGCAAVLNGHTMMDAALLRACPALRSIVFLGTGASSYIDVEAAAALGIAVRTVRGYGDRSVAEHTFALILAAIRRVTEMDRALRAGIWEPLSGSELEGKVLGIVGMGGIGRTLGGMAQAFGMHVLAWNRSPIAGEPSCRSVELDDLLRTADIVSLHLALTPETRSLISDARLRLMRPHTILVNTARGALVDEAALLTTLQERRIAHAALDVFGTEPLPRAHPLTTLDNVTLTAHAGYKTPEASRRLVLMALDLLRADLAVLAQGRTPSW